LDEQLLDLKQPQTIKQVKRLNITAQGTDFDYYSLPNRGKIQGINLKNPSGTGVIKSVTFRGDEVIYLDNVSRGEMFDHLTGLNLIPPAMANTAAGAFSFSWAFDDTDPVQSALAAQSTWLKIYTDVAAGGNVVAIVETVGAI
jgi:monoamine oxidase